MVRLLVIGSLAGVAACASQASGRFAPDDVADGSRRPAAHPGLKVQLAYQVGPAPECSNWYAALRKARIWAGCDLVTNAYDASSRNACQERVQSCARGCDICPIIGPGQGPPAAFADLGPIARDRGDPKIIHGIRGQQSVGRGSTILNQRLCDDISWVDVLGSTILHEALHHCRGGFGISDFLSNQSGCSASALERFCTGISSAGGL